MGRLVLILGGARSGKSSYAQRLAAERSGRVIYIATAKALDAEMEARIAIHRSERPGHWQTVELPAHIGHDIQEFLHLAELVLLDCLTMLVTNLILEASPDEEEPDEQAATQAVETEIESLSSAIKEGAADWIIVSNEVGLGLVPPYPLGRLFRDLLGRANKRLAQEADEVYWMVAGIPIPIHTFRLANGQPGT